MNDHAQGMSAPGMQFRDGQPGGLRRVRFGLVVAAIILSVGPPPAEAQVPRLPTVTPRKVDELFQGAQRWITYEPTNFIPTEWEQLAAPEQKAAYAKRVQLQIGRDLEQLLAPVNGEPSLDGIVTFHNIPGIDDEVPRLVKQKSNGRVKVLVGIWLYPPGGLVPGAPLPHNPSLVARTKEQVVLALRGEFHKDVDGFLVGHNPGDGWSIESLQQLIADLHQTGKPVSCTFPLVAYGDELVLRLHRAPTTQSGWVATRNRPNSNDCADFFAPDVQLPWNRNVSLSPDGAVNALHEEVVRCTAWSLRLRALYGEGAVTPWALLKMPAYPAGGDGTCYSKEGQALFYKEVSQGLFLPRHTRLCFHSAFDNAFKTEPAFAGQERFTGLWRTVEGPDGGLTHLPRPAWEWFTTLPAAQRRILPAAPQRP